MKGVGLDQRNILIIENLYWHQEAVVQVDNEISDEIEKQKGVKQACSPK